MTEYRKSHAQRRQTQVSGQEISRIACPPGFNTPVILGKLAHYPPSKPPANTMLLFRLSLQNIPPVCRVYLSQALSRKLSKHKEHTVAGQTPRPGPQIAV